VVDAHGVPPKANIPTVALPAADPYELFVVADVAEPFVSPEYVYLSRVVDLPIPPTNPIANIPTVELPAADPAKDAALEAVAEALTQPE
jgi:hypothetical protein